ncbi:efflux RND transporter periplasmic adaptor subunit [Thermohalobacter berrensis]|uniref:Efflux transporter periplasmic adaptor subunit n=1 Tax=Thermohalobacter berrensis TaxID=99594 RepID=A0A419T7V5_9FIRM|nr:efflux RND transporter periplasmic adaptor subunit [Thermohalobacter berrensis]RKD33519.1 efflux transporter periplasmic adaptor subunit [Thermohalobacter berrensis]
MKKILTLLMIIVLLGSLTIGCTPKEKQAEGAENNRNYIPVEVETVSKKTISQATTFTGKIYADKDVMVFPKTPGKVESVSVSIGDKVNKGDILFTLDKEDIQKQVDSAKVALDGAKANYELTKEKIENAKKTFERTKKLYQEGAVSKAQFEQAKLAASDKSLDAAKTQLQQAEVAYEQALDALNNTIVDSPIDGIVSTVNVEAGEMAANSQPAVTIVDMDRVYVQINVTEDIINKLQKGQEVEIQIPSVSKEKFRGKIANISPVANQRTQLYPIKIYIDNKNYIIKPGMFAQVKVNTDVREGVIAVKSEAVVQREGISLVYVVKENKAYEKEVRTGLDTGMYVEIIEGINEGEKVIVKGQNYVDDKSQVKIVRGE